MVDSPPGTLLLCVVAPSALLWLDDGGDVDEGVVAAVVEACTAKNASRFPSASPIDDDDTSEVDDCPLPTGVTLCVVVMAVVAVVGVASAPSRDDEVSVSCRVSRSEVETSSRGPPLEVVTLLNTNRLISFFKNRGLSISSRSCAGAGAAKHVAESSVDSNARDAANIIEDLRNMVEAKCDRPVDDYYENIMMLYVVLTPFPLSDAILIGIR